MAVFELKQSATQSTLKGGDTFKELNYAISNRTISDNIVTKDTLNLFLWKGLSEQIILQDSVKKFLGKSSPDAAGLSDIVTIILLVAESTSVNKSKSFGAPRWLVDTTIGSRQRYSSEDMETPN